MNKEDPYQVEGQSHSPRADVEGNGLHVLNTSDRSRYYSGICGGTSASGLSMDFVPKHELIQWESSTGL